MIPDHIKQQIMKNIDNEKNETLEELREVLTYPYHPDTKALIFRVESDRGAFGMNLLAVDQDGDYMRFNANGESLYNTKFNFFGFGFYAFEDCGVSVDETDLLEKMSKFARDYLYEWFADRLEELGGKEYPIDCVLQKHDALRGFHMQERKWISTYSV